MTRPDKMSSKLVATFVVALTALLAAGASTDEAKLSRQEALKAAEQPDFMAFMRRVSEGIGRSIEERQKAGKLRDENDPLAIVVGSLRGLREQIELKTGVSLDLEEEQQQQHPGMPRGMSDVGHTSSVGGALAELAPSLPILFADPETLRDLSERSRASAATFQDYIKLAEEQDPELRRANVEKIRARTMELMRESFKQELKKLATVALARWTSGALRRVPPGNLMALILHQVQAKVLESLVNFLIEILSKHSDKVVGKLQDFSRGVNTNRPDVEPTSSGRAKGNREEEEEEDDKGRWMLRYMID